VGEEIEVEGQWEELGGGQMEPVRSQVREFSGRERHRLWGRCCCWQGGFEQHCKIGAGRVESRKESLDEWNLGSLAVVMAEIIKI
jgi:hypothetical protein